MVKFDEIKRKIEFERRKRALIEKGKKVYNFCMDHKEGVALAITGMATLYKIGVKTGKKVEVRKQKKFAETHYYDHSAGCYIETLRRTSKQDGLARSIHHRTGKPYYQIYSEMGLLKK